MTEIDAVHARFEAFYAALEPAARAWLAALRGLDIDGLPPDGQLQALVLPDDDVVGALLDTRVLRNALVPAVANVADKQVQRAAKDRLEEVAVRLLPARARLIRDLGDVAYEVACYRTLITPDDCFDVSSFGVLAAMAMTNVLHVLATRRRPSKSGSTPDANVALRPLDVAARYVDGIRPGDVWLVDLLARTARRLHVEIAAAQSHAAAGRAQPEGADPRRKSSGSSSLDFAELVLVRFARLSVLHKLLEIDQFPTELAKRLHFQYWPGLPRILSDPGAGGLRAVIVGQLALRAVHDNTGQSRAAFIRFLQALLAVDRCRLDAIVLLAMLLWEVLEHGEHQLNALFDRPQTTSVLLAAVRAIEAPTDDGEDPTSASARKLNEIRACLDTFDQYKTWRVVAARVPAAEAANASASNDSE